MTDNKEVGCLDFFKKRVKRLLKRQGFKKNKDAVKFSKELNVNVKSYERKTENNNLDIILIDFTEGKLHLASLDVSMPMPIPMVAPFTIQKGDLQLFNAIESYLRVYSREREKEND